MEIFFRPIISFTESLALTSDVRLGVLGDRTISLDDRDFHVYIPVLNRSRLAADKFSLLRRLLYIGNWTLYINNHSRFISISQKLKLTINLCTTYLSLML